MKNLLSSWWLLLILFTVSLFCLAYGILQYNLDRPVTFSESIQLDNQQRLKWSIERGSNLSQVTTKLHNQRVIQHPFIVRVYAKFKGTTKIQAGDYFIAKTDSPRSLLNKFHKGLVMRYNITFPEGWTFEQWINHLAQVPQFSAVKTLSSNELLQKADINVTHPEGWFFPDTYSFSGSDSAIVILRQAHQQMLEKLDSAWQSRAADLPYKTAYEALIMASIIEKETGLAEEREAIAGVFVRRLQLGMRLQTDPTVIYGMGDQYKGNIRRQDLQQKTPYNTYRINGLPPTPIAMPGEAAIHAALNPKSGSSLYFVARGDGGHQFSDTIEQHQKAVKHYQINQRAKNYHSLPAQQQ